MNDLFSIVPPASPPRPPIAVFEPINNDVVLLKFSKEGGPEQEALGRVAQMFAALVTRGKAGLTSAEFPPGVRVSDSIHKLRHRHSLGIESERVGIAASSAASTRSTACRALFAWLSWFGPPRCAPARQR